MPQHQNVLFRASEELMRKARNLPLSIRYQDKDRTNWDILDYEVFYILKVIRFCLINDVWHDNPGDRLIDQMEAMAHAALAVLTLMHFAYCEASARPLYDEIVKLGRSEKTKDDRKTFEQAKIRTQSGRPPVPRRMVDTLSQGPNVIAIPKAVSKISVVDTPSQQPIAALPEAASKISAVDTPSQNPIATLPKAVSKISAVDALSQKHIAALPKAASKISIPGNNSSGTPLHHSNFSIIMRLRNNHQISQLLRDSLIITRFVCNHELS